jgi:hypothetical protein
MDETHMKQQRAAPGPGPPGELACQPVRAGVRGGRRRGGGGAARARGARAAVCAARARRGRAAGRTGAGQRRGARRPPHAPHAAPGSAPRVPSRGAGRPCNLPWLVAGGGAVGSRALASWRGTTGARCGCHAPAAWPVGMLRARVAQRASRARARARRRSCRRAASSARCARRCSAALRTTSRTSARSLRRCCRRAARAPRATRLRSQISSSPRTTIQRSRWARKTCSTACCSARAVGGTGCAQDVRTGARDRASWTDVTYHACACLPCCADALARTHVCTPVALVRSAALSGRAGHSSSTAVLHSQQVTDECLAGQARHG